MSTPSIAPSAQPTQAPNLNHTIRRAHDFERLQVEGQVPAALRGFLYRTGPGLLERFGQQVGHPFDADGAVTAVRFDDDGAHAATQVVESVEYREEEEAGRFLYGTSASWGRQLRNVLTSHKKATGNTNLLAWRDRLFALMENARLEELDPRTLHSLGTTDLGVVRDAFSAHPHRVHALQTTFNFGLRGTVIDLYALPDDGVARCLGSVEAPWPCMVHDFIATERHLIFVIGPARLLLWRALFAVGDLSQYFKWDPALGSRVIVVPLDDPGRATRIHVEPFWVWHFVNAFEDGDTVQVDLCRHQTFGAFAAPSSAGPTHSQPEYWRYALDVKRRTFGGAPLWTEPSEFPAVDPTRTGARQRFTFLQTFNDPGVARFDVDTGAVDAWGAPGNHLGVEPVFVPRPRVDRREGEGWVLQMFCDPMRDQSYVAVLDALHLAEGPLAKVWLPEAVPMTFHGIFVPAA